MIKKITFLIFVILLSSLCFAQEFSCEKWHTGKVFLKTGDTLFVRLLYDLEKECIYIEQKDKDPTIMSSVFFTGFQIEDSLLHKKRLFYVYPHFNNNNFELNTLFEKETHFKDYEVITREYMVYTAGSSIIMHGFNSDSRFIDYSYFLYKDKKLYQLTPNKKNILKLMKDHAKEIEDFIKEKKLKLSNRPDIITIFEYYNTL